MICGEKEIKPVDPGGMALSCLAETCLVLNMRVPGPGPRPMGKGGNLA
jgi:hypothetical protein